MGMLESIKPEDDMILCATESKAFLIDPTIDVGEVIECSPNLPSDILEAEEKPNGAIKIAILDEVDLALFQEHQYMIGCALCIYTECPELMEAALRAYHGRAFYDETGNFEEEFLLRMQNKYGLVCL